MWPSLSLISLLLLAGPGLGARDPRSLVNTFPFNAEAEGGHQEHHGGRQEARRLDTAAALASRGAKQVDKNKKRQYSDTGYNAGPVFHYWFLQKLYSF